MRRRRIVYAFAASLSLCVSGEMHGQRRAALDPWAPPTTLAMCRRSVAPGDSAGVIFQFVDGMEPIERRTVVAYDTLGVPRHLVLTILESDSTGAASGVVIALDFAPGGKSERRTVEVSRALQSKKNGAPAATTSDSLSREEVLRAKELANSLWRRRCGQRAR